MTKAARTRQFIIEQTAPLFNKKGYAGTSLQDISGATGLTKGSIYGNFQDKDEVALAAFDHNLSKVREIFAREQQKHAGTREKLLAYIAVYRDFRLHPFPEGGCPMQNTAIEADDTHPLLKRKARAAIESWKKNIMRLVETGIHEKEIRQEVQPEQVALTLIALIEGMTMIVNLSGRPGYRSQLLDSAQKYIEDLF